MKGDICKHLFWARHCSIHTGSSKRRSQARCFYYTPLQKRKVRYRQLPILLESQNRYTEKPLLQAMIPQTSWPSLSPHPLLKGRDLLSSLLCPRTDSPGTRTPYRSSGHSNTVVLLSECQSVPKTQGSKGSRDSVWSWPVTLGRPLNFWA